MLEVQSARPDPRLAPFVRAYVQRTATLRESTLTEPVLARLGVMMEFAFADQYDVRSYDNDQRNASANAALIGPITFRRVRLVMRGTIESLVVMFQPVGFHALFGLQTSMLAERGFDATAVLGSSMTRLYERLGNERLFSERIRVLDSFLLTRTASLRRADPALRALGRLAATGQHVSEAARMSGLSVRSLERKALDHIGASPKTIAQIARLGRALRLKRTGVSWTEVAVTAGYFDQAHLTRDFRLFSGAAPTQIVQEITPEHLIHFASPLTERAAHRGAGNFATLNRSAHEQSGAEASLSRPRDRDSTGQVELLSLSSCVLHRDKPSPVDGLLRTVSDQRSTHTWPLHSGVYEQRDHFGAFPQISAAQQRFDRDVNTKRTRARTC